MRMTKEKERESRRKHVGFERYPGRRSAFAMSVSVRLCPDRPGRKYTVLRGFSSTEAVAAISKHCRVNAGSMSTAAQMLRVGMSGLTRDLSLMHPDRERCHRIHALSDDPSSYETLYRTSPATAVYRLQ
jgi:hypothetical protein